MGKVSFGSSKSKSSTNQTQTPINPAWVEPQVQGIANNITGLLGSDASQYVAPVNGLLQQAGQGASELQPNNQAYDSASGLFQGLMNTGGQTYDPATIKANSLLSNLSSYMSPYTDDVVNSALDNFDYTAGQTRAQNKLDMANLDDAFGGSGRFITEPLLNSQLTMGRASLDAGLRDQAFNTGANLSNLDAGRRQDAAQFNANAFNGARQFNANSIEQALARQGNAAQGLLGAATAQGNDARANLGLLGELGATQQGIQQQQAQAPIDLLGSLTQMYGSLPLNLFQGQQLNGTSKGKNSSFGFTGGWSAKNGFGA